MQLYLDNMRILLIYLKQSTIKKDYEGVMEKVKSIEVKEKLVSQLLDEMRQTGFQGRKLGEVFDLWRKMIKEKNLLIVLGYAGSLSVCGQYKIIQWLIENHFVDVIVSTGANVSEDIVEAMGFNYYIGSHLANDKKLLDLDYNRYYDVYGKENDYGVMEDLIRDFYLTLSEGKAYSSPELLYMLGKFLVKKKINAIATTAYRHKVPIFCPAIVDSAFGESYLKVRQENNKKFIVDGMQDFYEWMSIGEKVKNVGVIYIGGGVPKDFTQLLATSLDFYAQRKIDKENVGKHGKERCYPHKYALQITMANPADGGLSGCTLEEAISWGKVLNTGEHATCYCDATIALPIITHALNELKLSRKGIDLDFLLSKYEC